jgi:hypothetical protein
MNLAYFVGPEAPHDWWWLFPAISAVGGLMGGGLGSYVSERGKIRAVQRKLTQVVEQNTRIAEGTEQIKQQISSEYRLWELRREAAYDVVKIMGTMSELLGAHAAAFSAWKSHEGEKGYEEYTEGQKTDVMALRARYRTAIENLWQLEGIASLLFEQGIFDQLQNVTSAALRWFDMNMTLDEEKQREGGDAFIRTRSAMTDLLRIELKKVKTPTAHTDECNLV